MSKILNREGRVFGCLCGLEKQAMRESVGLPNHIIEMMTEGGNWELIVSPRFFPDKAYRVTLPDAPVPTCPKCGSSIGQNKMGDGHWHCRNLSCTWKQPDYEQRPKIPKPMKGRHAGEYRQPLDGEVVFYQDCNGEWRLSHPCSVLNYGEKDKRWIAVKDAVPTHPSGCTCPTCFLTRPDVDAPVLTCPKCGMELEDRSAFAKDRAWVCIYGCGYSQPDSEQRPKMPAQCEQGYHYDCLLGPDGWEWLVVDAVHPSGCTCPVCFLTRPDCDEPEPAFTETAVGEFQPVKPDPLDREIATEEYLNDSGRDDPVPEKVIDPLGNYPDMKQMRDKINEIVAWSRAVTVWINANGAV